MQIFNKLNIFNRCSSLQVRSIVTYVNRRPPINKWREERGLPSNPNAFGALTDKPDYTFLDGRHTPMGTKQRIRLIRQKELAERVIRLTKEVDFAVDRHRRMLLEKEETEQNIINSKLQEKGKLELN